MSDDDKGGDHSGRAASDGPVHEGKDTRDSKDDDRRSGRDGNQPDRPSMGGDPEIQADKAARAAYEGGRKLLSPDQVETGRDAYVYIDRRVMPGLQETSTAPGRVPVEQIDQLRDFYVPVPGCDEMRQALRDRRLVVLVGTRGSGRSTTGLWLLDELADSAVARLDPAARPPLPGAEQIAPAHGYLSCLDHTPVPSRVAADRLAADLAAKNSYCVLTAHPSPTLRRELGFYCVEHEQADPVAILGRHVQTGVKPDDDEAFAGQMAELAILGR